MSLVVSRAPCLEYLSISQMVSVPMGTVPQLGHLKEITFQRDVHNNLKVLIHWIVVTQITRFYSPNKYYD